MFSVNEMHRLSVEDNNNFVPITRVIDPDTQDKYVEVFSDMEHNYVEAKVKNSVAKLMKRKILQRKFLLA